MASTPPAASASARVLDELARARLIVVSGKGGVGRTTVAACLALACARRGRRVLVGTTGRDDRLAWMLGADKLDPEAREVVQRLQIQRLDPQRCIVEYGGMLLPAERVSSLVLGNRVVRRLLPAIPGLEDYAVLGKAWYEATRGRVHDLVVLDGPASGHLRYVLGVPDAILDSTPRGPLAGEARKIRADLRDPEITRSVLVGLPEPWPLTELDELALGLSQEVGVAPGAVVLNGLWPAEAPPRAHDHAVAPMVQALDRAARRGREQREVMEAWRVRRSTEVPVLCLPWIFGGVEGPAGTQGLLAAMERGTTGAWGPVADALDPPAP